MTLTDLLSELNIPFKREGEHEHARSGWIQIDCPSCNQIGHFRLGIHLRYHYCNCWTCGHKSLYYSLLGVTDSKGSPDKRRNLREILALISQLGIHDKELRTPTTRGRLVIPENVDYLLTKHRKYLTHRGFDPDAITKLWLIKGIGQSRRLAWRLFIPIVNHGEIVSWTTRAVGNSKTARYISASPDQETINHKTLLYGEDYARHAIVVHEGCTDVWRTGPGAVATLGVGYSQAQVEKISKYPKRTICFDSDTDAQRRARQLADDLSVFPGETNIVSLETGKDSAEASAQEIQKLRRYLR